LLVLHRPTPNHHQTTTAVTLLAVPVHREVTEVHTAARRAVVKSYAAVGKILWSIDRARTISTFKNKNEINGFGNLGRPATFIVIIVVIKGY
jgi:hypothetical protein